METSDFNNAYENLWGTFGAHPNAFRGNSGKVETGLSNYKI